VLLHLGHMPTWVAIISVKLVLGAGHDATLGKVENNEKNQKRLLCHSNC
jgi:hypothetical protein